MGDRTAIEWSDATWNVVTGCTKISPGCANCYIDRTPPFRIAGRTFVNGKIPLITHEDRLLRPIAWERPRRIFVNSLSDVFHADYPRALLDSTFAVMTLAGWHQYQVLTKRHVDMIEYFRQSDVRQRQTHRVAEIWMALPKTHSKRAWLRADANEARVWLPPQIQMGITAENRKWLRERAAALKEVPAQVRWLSLEPLLEDVADVLDDVLADGKITWVVSGFESGPRRRPAELGERHVQWIRNIRDVCQKRGVAFLFKQWGGLSAKTGGRLLDGQTHDEYPRALI